MSGSPQDSSICYKVVKPLLSQQPVFPATVDRLLQLNKHVGKPREKLLEGFLRDTDLSAKVFLQGGGELQYQDSSAKSLIVEKIVDDAKLDEDLSVSIKSKIKKGLNLIPIHDVKTVENSRNVSLH